jgi:hypothetical protein
MLIVNHTCVYCMLIGNMWKCWSNKPKVSLSETNKPQLMMISQFVNGTLYHVVNPLTLGL